MSEIHLIDPLNTYLSSAGVDMHDDRLRGLARTISFSRIALTLLSRPSNPIIGAGKLTPPYYPLRILHLTTCPSASLRR